MAKEELCGALVVFLAILGTVRKRFKNSWQAFETYKPRQDVESLAGKGVLECSAADHSLEPCELYRYGRQLVLPEFGIDSQQRLKDSSVLVIGAGGIGCPVIALLAGAGIGRLGIVDDDVVSQNNLHRQTLYDSDWCGRPKVLSARDRASQINPHVQIEAYELKVTAENVEDLIDSYDLVIECSDSIATKYICNDACLLKSKPFIIGAAQGMEGQIAMFSGCDYATPGCYRCLFQNPPDREHRPSCSENGVLGPVPATIGAMAAQLSIQYIGELCNASELCKYFYTLDMKSGLGLYRLILPDPKPDCPVCIRPTTWTMEQSMNFCQDHDLQNNYKPPKKTGEDIGVDWTDLLKQEKNSYLLLDVRSATQFRIWSIIDSWNVPFRDLKRQNHDDGKKIIDNASQRGLRKIFVVCRRGVDSLTVASWLHPIASPLVDVFSVKGGLEALAKKYPDTYPQY